MPAKPLDPKQEPIVEQSLALLQRLLTPERTRTELVSGRPILPVAAVGALVVVGMKTVSPKTWVSVYIYRTWNQATAGLRVATSLMGKRDGDWTISSANGRMVLIGRADGQGPKASLARHTLNNILSAFDEEC